MMRRTATCAGLALALYLSSWIPFGSKPAEVFQAVDFDGIDVLVLQGNPSQVSFSRKKPGATYDPSDIPKLLERRDGAVLVLYPEQASRSGYEIRLPPTLRHLELDGAHVTVREELALARLLVKTRGDINWNGDITRLDIIDSRTRAKDGDCRYCGPGITIQSGKIQQLRISTGFSRVMLEAPDKLGRTTLRLGPDALFSLGMSSRQADVRLEPWQPGIIDDLPTEPELP